MVTICETREFTKFLIQRYGLKNVIKFGMLDYSKENFKKVFDNEINEVEEIFTKSIESMQFNSIFYDKGFIDKLSNNLQLYNTTTKPVLFKK